MSDKIKKLVRKLSFKKLSKDKFEDDNNDTNVTTPSKNKKNFFNKSSEKKKKGKKDYKNNKTEDVNVNLSVRFDDLSKEKEVKDGKATTTNNTIVDNTSDIETKECDTSMNHSIIDSDVDFDYNKKIESDEALIRGSNTEKLSPNQVIENNNEIIKESKKQTNDVTIVESNDHVSVQKEEEEVVTPSNESHAVSLAVAFSETKEDSTISSKDGTEDIAVANENGSEDFTVKDLLGKIGNEAVIATDESELCVDLENTSDHCDTIIINEVAPVVTTAELTNDNCTSSNAEIGMKDISNRKMITSIEDPPINSQNFEISSTQTEISSTEDSNIILSTTEVKNIDSTDDTDKENNTDIELSTIESPDNNTNTNSNDNRKDNSSYWSLTTAILITAAVVVGSTIIITRMKK